LQGSEKTIFIILSPVAFISKKLLKSITSKIKNLKSYIIVTLCPCGDIRLSDQKSHIKNLKSYIIVTLCPCGDIRLSDQKSLRRGGSKISNHISS